MDILTLLEELQTIARNGLNYAENPYDRERYEHLMRLTVEYYGQVLDVPSDDVKARFAQELGHITPKVGGDAAVFDAEGRILLQQRADNGKWCLPCGWAEANEDPKVTAVRETWEETGLEVRVLQFVGAYHRPANVGYGPHSLVSVVYLCEVIGGTLQKSDEGLDVRYWPLHDVPDWHGHHQHCAEDAYKIWLTHQS